MAKTWTNDYGIPPRWYWLIRPTLLYQLEAEERRRGRLALAVLSGLAGGFALDRR